MSSLRVWILILSGVCSAAGFALGLLVYGARHRPPAPERPFQDYEALAVETFELSPDRTRLFRAVLASYNQELDEVKERYVAESMSRMEPELRSIGTRYRDLIRNRVLPEEQRAEFDRLSESVQLTPK